jgi:ATP-dependent DNA helicase DinG
MTSTDSIFDLISPADLGLPKKFSNYRLQQREALNWLTEDCTHELSTACMPTGIGKSALAVSLARHLGAKGVYLVATKALQQQVFNEFSSMGIMADIRGRANYPCDRYGDCEAGYEEECSIADTTGCPYTCASERAKDSSIAVTNYSYWLHARKYNRQAIERDDRPVDLLICDEAHAVESQLTGFFGVHFSATDISMSAINHKVEESGLMPDQEWDKWARNRIASCIKRKEVIETRNPNAFRRDKSWKDLDELQTKCSKLVLMNQNWCWQFSDGAVDFQPVRLSGFMNQLFSSVPRVLMMSASLTPFQCSLLLKEDTKYDYRAWGPVFPPQNAPFYHIPCRKLTRNSTDEDYQEIVRQADTVIDHRLDRRGIIHTVSYARSQRMLQYSRHRDRFFWNASGKDLPTTLDRYRNSKNGILVTPSVEEGFDFPDAECEYQIILKFPFPNEGQRVIKERCNLIPNYRLAYAAQKIVQIKGRPIRHDKDRAETFILDNAVKQLTGPVGKSLLPPGFRIFTVNAPPAPPPRINI